MMRLDPAVLRDLLAEVWDEGNKRPRDEANPYRSGDG